MVICCVPQCKSRSDRGRSRDKDGNRITFHELPIDSKKREVWIKVIKYQESNSTRDWSGERLTVCSLHFHPRDFKPGLKIRCLRSDSVPSIFPESAKMKSIESVKDEHITDVACNRSTETGVNSTEFQKFETCADKSFNNNLPFQLTGLTPGLNVLCFLPVAPSVLPIQSASVGQTVGSGQRDIPIAKVPYDKTGETGNTSSHGSSLQDSAVNKSFGRKNMDMMQKENVSSVEECFTYSKLVKNLSLVKKPNQFWGVTPTDKFIIFSKWNHKYIPEKRIIVENNLNVKVFFGELEINTMNLMEFTCAEDVSALLEKVESIKCYEKEPVINYCT